MDSPSTSLSTRRLALIRFRIFDFQDDGGATDTQRHKAEGPRPYKSLPCDAPEHRIEIIGGLH